MDSIEVLVSNMNIKNTEEFKNFVNNINYQNENISVINQITEENISKINIEGKASLYSYEEKGLSRSRNRALKIAKSDICLFADDDIKYVSGYKNTIEKAYSKYKKADIIVFYIESKNSKRKIKRIRNGKINRLNIMKVRSSQISFKRKSVEECGVKFDENFGTGALYKNGEETIFLSDCIKKGLKVYSYNKTIGTAENKNSTWFRGYNEEFFFCRGAIFCRLYPIFKYSMILQFAIRKFRLYKKDYNFFSACKSMIQGVNDYKRRCKNECE